MTLTAEKIEQLRTKLEELPKAEKAARPQTKRSLVGELAPQLEAAKLRGYTLKDLAELLGKEGVSIHPAMLGQYLRAVKKESAEGGSVRRKAEVRKGKTPAALGKTHAKEAPSTSPATKQANSGANASKKIGGDKPRQQQKTSGQDGVRPTSATRKEAPQSSGGFIPRSDSNDI